MAVSFFLLGVAPVVAVVALVVAAVAASEPTDNPVKRDQPHPNPILKPDRNRVNRGLVCVLKKNSNKKKQ